MKIDEIVFVDYFFCEELVGEFCEIEMFCEFYELVIFVIVFLRMILV